MRFEVKRKEADGFDRLEEEFLFNETLFKVYRLEKFPVGLFH